MAEKHNLMSILQYAPKGLKLYSPCYGDVRFQRIEKDKIVCSAGLSEVSFGPFGTISTFGECMLFPSKEYTSWYSWQKLLFSIGDIIKFKKGENLIYAVVSEIRSDKVTLSSEVGLFGDIILSELVTELRDCEWVSPEEEKDFIEGISYYGLAVEKGKLKRLSTKFKVGDMIELKNGGGVLVYQVVKVSDGVYTVKSAITGSNIEIPEQQIGFYHLFGHNEKIVHVHEYNGDSISISNLTEERLEAIRNLVNQWVNEDKYKVN